jgi:hypothetical protein
MEWQLVLGAIVSDWRWMVGATPVDRPSRLLADGRMWRWIAGVAYAGLAALELVGNDAWRVAATPYLDIALIVGLFPIVWRSLRSKTIAELAEEERASDAALEGKAVDMELAENYGLVDETGELVRAPSSSETTVDIVSPKRPPFEPGVFAIRIIVTTAVVMAAWFVGQLGLALADWVHKRWYIVLPILAALGLAVWFLSRPRK